MRFVLMLIRHGEAVEGSGTASDHRRVLTPRGQKQSEALGAYLARSGVKPGLALVSDAARTTQTWAGVVVGAGGGWADISTDLQRLIYAAPVQQLRQLLAKTDGHQHSVVAVVGHNPSISDLASDLSARDLRFATADCIILATEAASWAEAAAGDGSWDLLVHHHAR